MIKILVVENEFKSGFFNRLKSIFTKNEIYVKFYNFASVEINYITLKRKKMSIPWFKIKSFFGGDGNNVLCDENLDLPASLGFSRFDDSEFRKILCVNSAKYVIQNLNSDPENLSVSLYDPFCEYQNILEDIIMFTRHIKIVTNNVPSYMKNIKFLTDDYGVCIPISNKLSWAFPCNILIAPKLDAKFYASSSTVVFTCQNSPPDGNGIIFNEYKIKASPQIKKIIPDSIPVELFIAALYDTKKFLKLGSLVPDYCLAGGKCIPINEVLKFILHGCSSAD